MCETIVYGWCLMLGEGPAMITYDYIIKLYIYTVFNLHFNLFQIFNHGTTTIIDDY